MPAKGRPARARAIAAPPPPRGAAVLRWLPSGRSLLTALAIVAIAAAGYVGARESSLFAVTTIEVRGAEGDLRDDVQRALRSLRGKSLVEVDRAAVARPLERIPWVAEITHDRAFPNTLRVTIVAQQPVAVVRRGARSWLVSERARVLERAEPRAWLALPRVWLATGAPPRVGSVVPEALAPAVGVLAAARALPAVRAARAAEGSVTLVLRSGVELRLGSPEDVAVKLAVARRLLPEIAPPGYLDLSVPERPVIGHDPQVAG